MSANQSWPRILYHKRMAPGGWRFDSEAELKGAGAGWVDDPIAAKVEVKPFQEPEPGESGPDPFVAAEEFHVGGPEPLDGMSADELRELAKVRGIKVHHKAGKEKILAALHGSQGDASA
jgi:hypothetical protein